MNETLAIILLLVTWLGAGLFTAALIWEGSNDDQLTRPKL